MSSRTLRGLTFDAGALLALDTPSKSAHMQARIASTLRRGAGICVPVVVIAQAWRSPRQARLHRLLKSPDVELVVMTAAAARAVGGLCASSSHDDIVDVFVAVCAREREHGVVTSDPADIGRIDPALPLIRV